MFKAFPPAMAGEHHDRAARVGIFGDAVQVVDGVLSGGQMGGVWRRNDLAMASLLRRARRLRTESASAGVTTKWYFGATAVTTKWYFATFQKSYFEDKPSSGKLLEPRERDNP